MADKYAASDTTALDSTPDTCLGLQSSTGTRGRLYDIIVGCAGTPADIAVDWKVKQGDGTGAGTGTALTEVKLDPASPVPQIAALGNYSAEPTNYGEPMLEFGLNLRATFRWVAAPGGEIVIPATANAVLGALPAHASSTTEVGCTMHWEE